MTTLSVCSEFIWNFAKWMVIRACIFSYICIFLYAYLKIFSSKKSIGGDCGYVIILIDRNQFDISIRIFQTLFHHAKCYDKTQIGSYTCWYCRLQYGRICWHRHRWIHGRHRGWSFQSHEMRFSMCGSLSWCSETIRSVVLNLNMRWPNYPVSTQSKLWLLMTWLCASSGHQHP